MSKPYTEADLALIFDADLIWRRKELSDLKVAVRGADLLARPVLLRATIAMSYAHWEGYVRLCANRYFEHLTLRKFAFSALERQIYVNHFLGRLNALTQARVGLEERCRLVNDILDSLSSKFSRLNPDLVDTRSNLNTDVIRDICLICGVGSIEFESERVFLDLQLLKRRNAIAHGQQEFIEANEIDELVGKTLGLMGTFRNLLENKIVQKQYAA